MCIELFRNCIIQICCYILNLVECITLCLDSTNKVEQWYVRHKYFIVLYHRLHVSTYMQVIFRPSITDNSIYV